MTETKSWTNEERTCPHCGYVTDMTSSVSENARPEPGAMTICIKCWNVGLFNDDMTIRVPTEDDWSAMIAEDPSILGLMAKLGQLRDMRESEKGQPRAMPAPKDLVPSVAVLQRPDGKFSLVGEVPAELGFVWRISGDPVTQQDAVRLSMMPSSALFELVRPRAWDTAKAAHRDAEAFGCKVVSTEVANRLAEKHNARA